jgi:hypothetical protein
VVQAASKALQSLLMEYPTPAKYLEFMKQDQVKIFIDGTNINTAVNTCMLQNRLTQSNRPALDYNKLVTRVAASRQVDSIVFAGTIPEQDYFKEKKAIENLNIHGPCLLHLISGDAKEHTVDPSIVSAMYHALDMYPDPRDAQTIILLTGDGNSHGNIGPMGNSTTTARYVSVLMTAHSNDLESYHNQ